MNHFQHKGDELYAGDVALKDIVAAAGSPVYVRGREMVEDLIRGERIASFL